MVTPSSSVRPVTCGSKAKPRIAEQVDVVRLDGLPGSLLHVRRADGAVLRADRDPDPLWRITSALASRVRPIAWMYSPA